MIKVVVVWVNSNIIREAFWALFGQSYNSTKLSDIIVELYS